MVIHELLFADDAVLVADTKDHLQHLVNYFSDTCKEFGLQINLKKAKVLGQDTASL